MSKYRPEPSRVLRTHQEAQKSYDRLSRWYDYLASSEGPFAKRALQMLAVRSGEVVLEIGFGTGQILPALADQTKPGGHVAGIDISPGMAAVARKHLLDAKKWQNVALHLGDASALPYAMGVFNAILMTFTLELFDTPDIPRVLAECRRVLSGDGRLCVASLVMKDKSNLITRLYDWVHMKIPTWVDCRPIPLQNLLTESGFTSYKIWPGSLWGLPIEIVCAYSGNQMDYRS